MNDQELAKLRALLTLTVCYYGQQSSDAVISMYAHDLLDLDFEAVSKSLERFRKDPAMRKCPLPAEIRASISNLDDSGDSRESAARIYTAISRYGWTNAARARVYIGSLGWAVVELQGGWENVCAMCKDDNSGILMAQWRELASGLRRKDRRFVNPENQEKIEDNNKILNLIESTLKKI